MKEAIIYSDSGNTQTASFEDNSMVDCYLLDHLRSYTTQNKKAFAIVSDGTEINFVIIEDNCTKWMSPENFFEKIII
jgi:hypothetical protein